MPLGLLGIVVFLVAGVWVLVLLCPVFPGLKESPIVPLAESELLAEILEEVRQAIGVTFPQDKW